MTSAESPIAGGWTIASAFSARSFWAEFQAWRERRRIWAVLYRLDDVELRDIGITRGEIGYLASRANMRSNDR